MTVKRLYIATLALVCTAPLQQLAAESDMLQAWDNRCGSCHGDVSNFVAKRLRAREGTLSGIKEPARDMREFLATHYGAKSNVDAYYDLLLTYAKEQAK